jgi:hypothetical protein
MRTIALALATLLGSAATLSAQERSPRPELRPFVGVHFPTGDQRSLFNDAVMLGAQGALELRPTFHVLATFGWVHGKNKYAVANDNVNLFAYDMGVEWNMIRAIEPNWQLSPFLGIGAGGRTYSFRAPTLATRTCAAAYGALGTELQVRRVAFRVEARDNVFCYRAPIAGDESRTRNDVGLTFGIAYHFR